MACPGTTPKGGRKRRKVLCHIVCREKLTQDAEELVLRRRRRADLEIRSTKYNMIYGVGGHKEANLFGRGEHDIVYIGWLVHTKEANLFCLVRFYYAIHGEDNVVLCYAGRERRHGDIPT